MHDRIQRKDHAVKPSMTKAERRIKHDLDHKVDQQLLTLFIKDGFDELDLIEKEKLCLQEIHSLL